MVNDPSKPRLQVKDLEGMNRHDHRVPWVSRIAWILDNLVRIPFVRKRIGIDPILGLIPGGGDLASGLLGTLAVGTAIKRKVPLLVAVRMVANLLLNALIGSIPFLGDAFSFVYKSNARNHALLSAALDGKDDDQDEAGWLAVILLCGLLVVVLIALIGAVAFGCYLLWRVFTGGS